MQLVRPCPSANGKDQGSSPYKGESAPGSAVKVMTAAERKLWPAYLRCRGSFTGWAVYLPLPCAADLRRLRGSQPSCRDTRDPRAPVSGPPVRFGDGGLSFFIRYFLPRFLYKRTVEEQSKTHSFSFRAMTEIQTTRVRPLYRGTQLVWYLFGIIETLLLLRFVLRLLAANPNAGFTAFIYAVSYPFVAPFINVFGPSRVVGSVIEWTTILAMLVYYLVALGISRLLVMSKPVSGLEADVKLQEQDV